MVSSRSDALRGCYFEIGWGASARAPGSAVSSFEAVSPVSFPAKVRERFAWLSRSTSRTGRPCWVYPAL